MPKRLGDAEGAPCAFREVLDQRELAPRHVRRCNQQWIDPAERGLAELG